MINGNEFLKLFLISMYTYITLSGTNTALCSRINQDSQFNLGSCSEENKIAEKVKESSDQYGQSDTIKAIDNFINIISESDDETKKIKSAINFLTINLKFKSIKEKKHESYEELFTKAAEPICLLFALGRVSELASESKKDNDKLSNSISSV